MVQTQRAERERREVDFRPIDGDGHIVEPKAKLLEYLEMPYQEHYSTGSGLGGLAPHDGWNRSRFDRPRHGGRGDKIEDWLEALEWGDLEKAVLYPTGGLFAGFIKDPDYAAAYSRAYNNWLALEVCKPSGGRILGAALLPVQDPEEAAKELRRAKTEMGFSAAMMCADGSHLLGHKSYDPVFRTAAELDVAIGIHASGSHMGGAGLEMFPKFIQAHTTSHPFGILRQFTSMMFEGVFEKFPTVRFGFLEAGATWVPWYLDRMDEEYEHRGKVEAPLLSKKPSEYVHEGGNIFFGCEAEERMLSQTMNLIGDDLIMYATDWPHWDGDYPESLHEMQDRTDLSDRQRYNILRGAAVRFYNLK